MWRTSAIPLNLTPFGPETLIFPPTGFSFEEPAVDEGAEDGAGLLILTRSAQLLGLDAAAMAVGKGAVRCSSSAAPVPFTVDGVTSPVAADDSTVPLTAPSCGCCWPRSGRCAYTEPAALVFDGNPAEATHENRG